MGRDGRLEETPRVLERLEGEIAGLTVRLREFQSTRAKAS